MGELKWDWVYIPYLDAPDEQKESAIKAGYAKVYFKSEVDAAIAELKDKCQMHDFFWEGCGFAKRGFKNTIAVSETFDRIEAENAELKKKLEDVQASHYAEMVDAGMRERRLRMALYKAIANWAKSERYTEATWHGDEHREELWAEVQNKCLKKAEEYK